MKRISGVAVLALTAAAGGAYAQGGPVNHHQAPTASHAPMATASPPPPPAVAADMSPPGPGIEDAIGRTEDALREDLSHGRISPRRAAVVRRELRRIRGQVDKLHYRLAKIADRLPGVREAGAPPN